MSGHAHAQVVELAADDRHGRRGGVVVDGDAHELRCRHGPAPRPGARWRPRRRCRCWSSTGRRPGAPSRRARPRRPSSRSGVAARSTPSGSPAHQPPDVEEGDPDEERHQQHEARRGRRALEAGRDAVAGQPAERPPRTRPPSSGGNGRTLTTARLAESRPMSQNRKTGGSWVRNDPTASTMPTGPGPAGWPGCAPGPEGRGG